MMGESTKLGRKGEGQGMTLAQARRLYNEVTGDDVSGNEQAAIHLEMQAVVAAKSDRAASNVIRWWGCWDRKHTATACARRLRQTWRRSHGRCFR